MKKRTIKDNLIRIIAIVMCLCTLIPFMPRKSEAAGTADKWFAGKVVPKFMDWTISGIGGDLINLMLAIPDGLLGISEMYVGGVKEAYRYDVDGKKRK